MDEKRIERLVGMLYDKGESETKQALEDLKISDEEREEIYRRLSELQLPPEGLSPEQLREKEHFQQLVHLARRGKIILFIGAGLSVGVGMPSIGQLLDVLRTEAREFGLDIVPDTPFPEVARTVEKAVGRQSMVVEVLRREFDKALKYDPPPYRKGGYRLLAALPRQLTRVVVTTNWDSLLCRAFEDVGESATEILEGTQLTLVPVAEHAIVKLHGDFQAPERVVITESDYAIAAAQIASRTAGTLWGYVATLLSQYSFVFVGYNLADPDFRLLRHMVEIGGGARLAPHFFVAPLSRDKEEAALRWADVRPISATATNFLLALFQELDEFVNRQIELDLAFRPAHSFVEFYGPFGSGKTALLDAAERQAQAVGWSPHQIVRVNWGRRRDGTLRDPVNSRAGIIQVLNEDLKPSMVLKRFSDFGSYLRDKAGVFLVFDATERVQDQKSLISLIVDDAAPAIQEMNERGQRSRLLLGSRYPLQGWPYAFRRDLRSHALTPFDATVVREMAHRLLLATDPDSQERFRPELINDILEVSSGHAGFIKAILMGLLSEEGRNGGCIQLPPRLVEDVKSQYISRFNAEIDRHVPWKDKTLKEVYEGTLCVFRWLNREIVRQLDLPFDPLSDLMAIYVLSQEFINDQVIRRTKMFWLQYKQRAKFVEAHKKAQEIFYSGIERLSYPIQLGYILEWLFHTAHLLIAEEPRDVEVRRERLVDQIESFCYRADQKLVRGDVGSELVHRVTAEDLELWNLLKECVGTDGVEVIFAILERKEVLDVG